MHRHRGVSLDQLIGTIPLTALLIGMAILIDVAVSRELARGELNMTIIIGVAALTLISVCNWRWGVLILLAYVTVEGFVILLLYPSSTPQLFKDALVVAVYAG